MTLESIQQICDDIQLNEGQTELKRIVFAHADRRAFLRLFEAAASHELRVSHIVFSAARWVPSGIAAFVYADGQVYMGAINGIGYAHIENMIYVGDL